MISLTEPRGGGGLTGTERAVFHDLRSAIIEQRLPPGAKLTEEELADIYGMSRMRVRRVLLCLSHDRVVTQIAGRGAFVASPSAAEARAVFEARRLIETAALADMAGPASPALIARLKAVIAVEQAAVKGGRWPDAIRASGLFHVELIAGVGNSTIAGIVEGLVSRSSLAIALYQRGRPPVCADDHHGRLVATLGTRNFRRAAAVMREHLSEIEAGLDLDERPARRVTLHEALRGAPSAKPRKTASRPMTSGSR